MKKIERLISAVERQNLYLAQILDNIVIIAKRAQGFDGSPGSKVKEIEKGNLREMEKELLEAIERDVEWQEDLENCAY